MPSSMIQLPCSSDNLCTYHKHWGASSRFWSAEDAPMSDNIVTTTSTAEGVESETTFYPQNISSAEAVPIKKLPAELLLIIIAYLPSVERACLALTCRLFAYNLGSDIWRQASKAGQASWVKQADMLDMLQKDLSSKDRWRCDECICFHPRCRLAPKADPGSRLGLKSRLNAILSIEGRREKSLQLGPPLDPLYIMSFPLLKAAMDRHTTGAPHGVCLDTLRCQGIRTIRVSDTVNIVLRYDFLPKIVLDRLLLRSTYTFRRFRTMFVRNVNVQETTLENFLEGSDIWICGHERVGSCIQSFQKQSRGQKLRHEGKCSYCPTQYSALLLPDVAIQIRVWQNLGFGRSSNDPKWRHISRRRKLNRTYSWDGEDIAGAFERILCSTKNEFERQLNRSDGGGSWYDPELQKRCYRTLPAKLAERL